jgi:hypothetical protein
LFFLVIKHLWWNETAEFSLDQFGSFSVGREGPVSGGTRGYITYPKKNCLAGFATIERVLR